MILVLYKVLLKPISKSRTKIAECDYYAWTIMRRMIRDR